MVCGTTTNPFPKIRCVASFCMIVALSFWLTACDDPKPIKIGYIGGLSGRAADLGIASRNAVQLAVEEVNRDGGINGRKIELLVRDDANDPNIAADVVRKLHAAGISALIGPNISAIGVGILPVINELKLVTISPTISSMIFADKDDYMFRINWTSQFNAQGFADHYAARGLKRIAVAFDRNNKVFSESWLNEFARRFVTLGGEIIATDQFDANTARGYSDTAKQLLEKTPEAILLVANSVDAARLAQQIRKLDGKTLLIAATWAASEILVTIGGTAVEGLESVQPYDRNDPSEGYLRFRNAYKKQFQEEPGFSSISAYDAMIVLVKALADQDDMPLKETLLALAPVQGLQQQIKFNRFGDTQRKAYFVVVKNGEFRPL